MMHKTNVEGGGGGVGGAGGRNGWGSCFVIMKGNGMGQVSPGEMERIR